jgi:pimeloyl-ACP methyl ester carboxylesterase
VNLIDATYRTLAASPSRGITGYSMGGWGAMHLALKYPSVFSVVISQAGFYDSRSQWADGLARQLVNLHPSTLAQFEALPFPVNAIQALFAGLIANPLRPSLFTDYPYDLVNGQLSLNTSVHQRCLDRDVQNGDLPRYVAQPIKLNGIKVVHGTTDNVVPISEARNFTNALTAAAVPFSYEQHTGNHIYRADLAIPYLATNLLGGQKYIAPPRLVAAFMTNQTAITFPTQTGVTYNVYSSPQLETPFENWAKFQSIDGNGLSAKITIPLESGQLFLRLAGTNN